MSGVVGTILKKDLIELPPPKIKEYFDYVKFLPLYITPIGISIFATVCVIILAGLHLYFVLRYVSHPSMQNDLYWIVFLCPIVSICNSIGICAPRTAVFLYSVGIVYFLLCIFVLVTLMTTLYGSRTVMCAKLEEKGVELNPRVFPLGCCLLCVPNIKPTPRNVRYLEMAVFQSPIIRVIIEIVSIAVYFEYESKNNWFFAPANFISFISMIIASYSSYILMPAGCKQLRQYRFLAMFRMVDWAQFVYNVQKHVLEAIILLEIFGAEEDKLLGPTVKIQIWASFLATIEMLFLSCLATFFFRPSKAAFFDKYSVSSRLPATSPGLAPTASPNPFVCYPALDPTMTDEPEFSPKKVSTEKITNVQAAEKESDRKMPKTAPTQMSTERPQSKSKEPLQQQQQQLQRLPPPKERQQHPAQEYLQQQQISPNGNEKTKTPATATTTATPITPLLRTSTNDPNSTTNVEILQVEPTQEITDNKI